MASSTLHPVELPGRLGSFRSSLELPFGLERWHYRRAVVLSLVAVAVSPLARLWTLESQLVLLAATVGFFGLPHGGLDFFQARAMLRPRVGAWWPLMFTVGYGAAMLLVLSAWYVAPGVSLLAFLLASMLHFGSEDAYFVGTRGTWRALDLAARGSLPILVPLAVHRETTLFFEWLLPVGTSLDASLLQTGAQLSLLVAFVGIVASCSRATTRAEVIRLVVLTAVFAALPPLLSFPVYFCVWHAPRHVLAVSRQLAFTPRALGASLGYVALPLALVVVVGAVAAWLYLRVQGLGFAPATARVVFVGLSVLTAPHMLLDAWFDRSHP